MKLPVLCTFALLAASSAALAGSFGGPPPFTDLSPLQSGIDGSYQATARGENLVGVIRFAYQNGVQSSIPSSNQYTFFVAGTTVSGTVTAAIRGKSIAGVLAGQDFNVPTNESGSTELPLVFIVRGSRGSGSFEGSIDLEDRMSVFSGDGIMGPAAGESNTVIGINEGTGVLNSVPLSIILTNFFIPASNLPTTPFTFEGVRTSIFAQGSGGFTQTATDTTTN